MHAVGEVEVDPRRAVVHEEGWQSWSPTSTYRLDQRPWRGTDPVFFAMSYKDPAGLAAGLLVAVLGLRLFMGRRLRAARDEQTRGERESHH